ncbi:MAG: lytic murein transglycosylase, partial [Pseudomonadota bacterium]
MSVMRAICFAAILTLGFAPIANAQSKALAETQYREWIEEETWPQARARGVSRDTFERALGNARLNWDLPDLVPPGSKAAPPRRNFQAEFRSPARYFRHAASDASVGRSLAQRHAALLARLE